MPNQKQVKYTWIDRVFLFKKEGIEYRLRVFQYKPELTSIELAILHMNLEQNKLIWVKDLLT